MPAIPGLPELGVVEKPLMNPREAGKAGAAIAGMGEDVEGMAEQSLAIEAHMREAQKHVDIVAAQNELNSADDQLQINLKKTQNSRDVAAVVAQAQEDRNSIAAKWSSSGSPAAVEIQQASDRLKPRVDHLGQMRQIDLMGKELDSQNTLQMQKLMPDLVTAIRNGDTAGAKAIQNHVSSLWDSPLVSDAEKQTQMEAFREATQKQLNEAAITSADPAEREQAISQLTKGGKGPLDLTNLPAGDLSALRAHAEETDQRLNNLAEARSMNGAMNVMDAAFQAPEYKDNFEAQQKALQDPEWLKQHGIVAPDGSPDRIKAEKLSAEVERQRTLRNQEQGDKDQGIISKYVPNVMKMSESQVTSLGKEGLSPRGISALEMERKRQIAEIQSRNLQERVLTRQQAAEDSYELVARLGSQPGYLTRNDIPDLMKSNPKMKYSDALHVVEMRSAQADPNFQSAMKIFEDAANQGAMTLSDVGEANIAMLKRAKEGITGTDLMKFASETVRPHVEKDIKNRLDQIVYPQLATPAATPGAAQPGLFSRIGTWAANRVITNAFPKTLKSAADQESAARQAPTSRKEYFDAMKTANPGATDAAIDKYLDDKGIK